MQPKLRDEWLGIIRTEVLRIRLYAGMDVRGHGMLSCSEMKGYGSGYAQGRTAGIRGCTFAYRGEGLSLFHDEKSSPRAKHLNG